MTERKIQLTDEAKKRLESAVDSYREVIMESLEQNKFVPGERIVEITASDVENAVNEFRYGSSRRVEVYKVYSQFVLIIGVAALAFGLLYPFVRDAFSNPLQMIALLAGAYLTIGGLLYYRLMSLRNRAVPRSIERSLDKRIERLERLLSESNRQRANST